MSRRKGIPKTGGRKIGTPNKVTVELQERLKSFLEQNLVGVGAKAGASFNIWTVRYCLRYITKQQTLNSGF